MTDHDQPFRRTRTHHVVEQHAFDEVEPWEDEHHRRSIGIDPRLARVGAVAVAGVLMIPIALALREDDEAGLRSDESAVTTVVPAVAPPAPTSVTIPITAAAVAATSVPAPAPAAVVNDDGATAPAREEAPDPPTCAGTYTVVFNDYWHRFPASSGATVEEWLAANGASLETPLYVGDELCIPQGATAPAPASTTTEPPPATTVAPPSSSPPPSVTTPPPPPPTAPTAPPPPVTTAAPTPPPAVTSPPATTPPTTAAGAPRTPAEVEALIRAVWPDDVEDRALTIARRESGLRPDAYNGWCCYGLFQIYFDANRSWLASVGVTSAEQLFDARTNVDVAYAMYQRSGWAPWRSTDPGT